jgi:hypothetical protein
MMKQHERNVIHGKKYIIFIFEFVLFCFLTVICRGIDVTIAWIDTLRSSHSHSESAPKIVSNSKDK